MENNNIKFMVSGVYYLSYAKITKIEIERETKHSIQIKNKKGLIRKITEDTRIFDTYKEAYIFLVQKAKNKMENKQKQFQEATKLYKKIKNMEENRK
jgi:hypothetical protein